MKKKTNVIVTGIINILVHFQSFLPEEVFWERKLATANNSLTENSMGIYFSNKEKKDIKKDLQGLRDRLNKSKKEEAGAGEEGTDELVNKYKKDTPNA